MVPVNNNRHRNRSEPFLSVQDNRRYGSMYRAQTRPGIARRAYYAKEGAAQARRCAARTPSRTQPVPNAATEMARLFCITLGIARPVRPAGKQQTQTARMPSSANSSRHGPASGAIAQSGQRADSEPEMSGSLQCIRVDHRRSGRENTPPAAGSAVGGSAVFTAPQRNAGVREKQQQAGWRDGAGARQRDGRRELADFVF